MNKNLILIATALALSLAGVGCNKSGRLAEPSAFKTPAGPVELKWKWPRGEYIVQDMNMEQHMELSIPGMPAPMRQNGTFGQEYGLRVLNETHDGGHEVELEFLTARMGATRAGKTLLDYDSAKRSPTDKGNPVAGMFGKIIGSKIQYFLNASNEVERMDGVDELEDQLSSGAHTGELAPLKSMYGKGYLKQMMSHSYYLPPRAVQPGDSWPVQIEFPMDPMGTISVNYQFTFQSWEMHGKRNCARLEFQGTLKTTSDPNSNPSGMSFSILAGKSSGVSWFDPELGITIDTTVNQDLTMVMNLPAKQPGNPGATGRTQIITNQMSQVITVKLVSVK